MTPTNATAPQHSSTASIDLAPHGRFSATVEALRAAETHSKATLAEHIAAQYRGRSVTPHGTHAYWLKFPKAVLAIIAGDFQIGARSTR